MKVETKNGTLVVTLPLQRPTPSSSGKTRLVASSGGNKKTDVFIGGKQLIVSVNAYIKEEKKNN